MLAWDHLRFALALARHGTVAQAGAALGLEPAAATERFRAMEQAAGATLFLRTRTGVEPTAAGWRLLRAAERLAEEMSRVKRALPAPPASRPRVRVAVDSELGALWLGAAGETGLSATAEVELELVEAGDAQLTVGWERPARAGWTGRRLGTLGVGLYAASSYLSERARPRTPEALAGHAWVLTSGTASASPAGRWAERLAGDGTVALRAADPGLRVAAVVAGLGVGVLLQGSEEAHPELVRLFPLPALRTRAVWLGRPRQGQGAPQLRAAAKALDLTLGDAVRRWARRG